MEPSSFIVILVQAGILVFCAPLVKGMIKKIKARLQNRVGPPLLQGYYDLAKLFQKESVVSTNASFIFHMTPLVVFGVSVMLALLIPTLFSFSPLASFGDIIFIVCLLGLSVFFIVLAGLDTGSTFGGMGSAREMMVYSLSEPAMMLVIFTLAIVNGTTQLAGIVTHALGNPEVIFQVSNMFAFFAFFVVALAENARIPVDNPATHLELTMVHEAMILEYSGRQFAFIEWASAIKLTVFLALLVTIFFPFGIATSYSLPAFIISLILFLLKIMLTVIIIAGIESSVAKLRLFRLPDFLGIAVVLSVIALISRFFI